MKVIVAPKNTHLTLLNSLRKKDPFLDIKLISKDELSRYLFPSVLEEAIIYLMCEYHFSYDVSKNYLRFLPFVEKDNKDSRLHFLYLLREKLRENSLLLDPIDTPLPFNEILIIGYTEDDIELNRIIKKLNLEYNYISLDKGTYEKKISIFNKIEDEVYFILNSISGLIDSGVPIKDIYIFRRNRIYDYYLNKFSTLFGYHLNIKSDISLFSTGGAKEFIKAYKENEDINESLSLLKEEMKDDPLYLELEEVINQSTIEGISFGIQYDYLINKLKEKKISSKKYDQAVNVIDSPLYDIDKHVFVLGFAQGCYPISGKDTGFLNENELEEIGIISAKGRTKIDEELLLSYFHSKNNFHFSYAIKSSEGDNYLSPLIRPMNLLKHYPKLEDNFYSEEVLKLIYADLKDLEYFYKEKGEDYFKVRDVVSINYNSYDNSYSRKANVYDNNSIITLSTTSLDRYMNCPFAYYLEKIIKLDEFEENFNIIIGKIAHKMFEHFREDDFDFDKEYEKVVEEYELSPSEKYTLNHSLKEQIRTAVDAIRKRENYYTNPTIENEKKVNYQLTDKTNIFGIIDNFVLLGKNSFICIDYKTGGTKFDDSYLQYGLSSQLPTYALLVVENEKYKGCTPVGLFLNNVISNSPNIEMKEDELIPSHLKLNGKVLGNLNVVCTIDSTIASGESSFISGVRIKKSGELSGSATVGDQTFKDYISTVKELYLKMDKELRNNNFDISPVYKSERDTACAHCNFKDVCFVRNKQYRRLVEEEDE